MRSVLLVAAAAAPFWFLQMADTQFGMYEKDAGFAQETANYEFAIATANRLKPRFVIVCGDLVNKPGDEAQIAEYERISNKLDPGIRLYSVAGNHDVGNEPTVEALAAYRKRFGADYYSFREGPLYGIVLNSSLISTSRRRGGSGCFRRFTRRGSALFSPVTITGTRWGETEGWRW